MKLTSPVFAIIFLLFALPYQAVASQSEYRVVDKFPGKAVSSAAGIYVGKRGDQKGNLYANGYAYDGTGKMLGIVRSSSDNGRNWRVSDIYEHFPGNGFNWAYRSTTDSKGNVYVIHSNYDSQDFDSNEKTAWVVRKSTNKGRTWTTIHVQNRAYGLGIFVDNKDRLYIGGAAQANDVPDNIDSPSSVALLRSNDRGHTWQTLDLTRIDNLNTGLISIVVTRKGHIFTSGNAASPQGNRWSFVRRSTDDGRTWETVDRHRIAEGYNSETYHVVEGKHGILYSSGYAIDTTNKPHWIIRKSLDDGRTWTPYVDYIGEFEQGARTHGTTRAPNGRVFSCGSVIKENTREWRVLEIL